MNHLHGDLAICHWWRHRAPSCGGWTEKPITRHHPVQSACGSLVMKVDHPAECVAQLIACKKGDLDPTGFSDLAMIWTVDPDAVAAGLVHVREYVPAMSAKFSMRRMGWFENLELTKKGQSIAGRQGGILFDFFSWLEDWDYKPWAWRFQTLEKKKQ